MNARKIIALLRKLSNPENVKGMARFGINTKGTLGVTVAEIRKIAKIAGKDHEIAAVLWKSGIHEARILASIMDEPHKITEVQMDSWANDFDSWDVCDQVCMNLFVKAGPAWKKAVQWSGSDKEFVKRAGFSLMASLAVHDKKSPDEKFSAFMPLIRDASTDERNYVKKAVNWALRQIGKRNEKLNRTAVKTAEEILKIDSPAAVWIATDALRELKSESVRNRLKAVKPSQEHDRKQ